MKLLSVVLGNNEKYNNDWIIAKDQYDNDVVINESTSQKLRIGKYLVPKLELISNEEINTELGTDIVTIHNFSDDSHHIVNKKNFSIIMLKNSNKDGDKFANYHLMYVTIPTENVKIVDSMVNLNYAEIINTYRSNNMLGCVIKLDTSRFPNITLNGDESNSSAYSNYRDNEVKIGEFILYNSTASNEDENLVRKVITVDRELRSLHVTSSYTMDDYYKDELDRMLESNFFKKIIISPTKEIRTSVYIVNENRLEEFNQAVGENEDLTILAVDPTIFKKGTPEALTYFDQVMKDHILNNKVRAITVVGIKLPKDFYTKYKVSTCFSHDLSTGMIRCVKA